MKASKRSFRKKKKKKKGGSISGHNNTPCSCYNLCKKIELRSKLEKKTHR